jgi:type IV pilus assembly protein PilW
MIGVLVIMQVARTGEAQKRVTASSGDTQTSGAMGIYSIQRDMKQAGYGLNSLNVLGCSLTLPAPASRTLDPLAPVIINPPVAVVPNGGSMDTLLIVYGNSEGSPEGDTINGAFPFGDSQEIGLMSAINFKVDEWVVAAPPVPEAGCALTMKQISVVNPAASTITVPNIGATDGQTLFDIGFAPRVVAYAIRDGNLSSCDYQLADCSSAANWEIVASGIVGLYAQYGHASTATGGVDSWDRTSPVYTDPEQEKFACDWARISAIRLALVARNSEPSKDPITTSAPVWAGSGGHAIDLSAIGGPNYRYQVYETVIPLRNIPWMGSCS